MVRAQNCQQGQGSESLTLHYHHHCTTCTTAPLHHHRVCAHAAMNVVREIGRINAAELDIALTNPAASWHQQYKDSAYLFVGGLPYDLTEGDVITIFSQFGEVVDVHLPRGGGGGTGAPKEGAEKTATTTTTTGKHRGFGFLMYEDQRSTVLAVDNLNGAHVLGRTLRVDHVANYQQPKQRTKDGTLVEADTKSLNAAPHIAQHNDDDDEDAQDEQDPMAAYLRKRRDTDDDADAAAAAKRQRKQERAQIRAQRQARRDRHSRHQ